MESAVETVESSPASQPGRAGTWHWNKPVDIRNAREFHTIAVAMMKPGQSGPIILDLSEAVYLDACGLQLLVALAVQCLTRGRLFEISRAPYAIQRDLQLAGVSYLMSQE